MRVGCPKREPVASLHPGALAAASKETGRAKAVQGNKSAPAAPAISDRPNAVACAKVENFAQAKKPHVWTDEKQTESIAAGRPFPSGGSSSVGWLRA